MGYDYKKPFYWSRFSTRVAEILFCDFPIWNRNRIIFIRKVKKRYKFFVTTRKIWTKLFDKTNFMFDFAYKKFDFWALSLLLSDRFGFESRREDQKNTDSWIDIRIFSLNATKRIEKFILWICVLFLVLTKC